ncbi:hypothetical protein BG004_006990 [Podila humilis]|nr:hypothetical protein BG004_006990 [Podila humilis]
MTKRESPILAASDIDMDIVETTAKKAKTAHEKHAFPQDIYTIKADCLKNSKFEILYMACRARAELPRLMLEYVGAKYTSKTPLNWPAGKDKTPFGVLPILYHTKPNGDVVEIPETDALTRYIARLFGLEGDNFDDQTTVDIAYSGSHNFYDILRENLWTKPDMHDKETVKIVFEKLEKIFDGLEKILVKNHSNGYFVKEKTTFADFCVYDWLNYLFEDYPESAKAAINANKRSGLYALYTRLDSHPRIRAYIEGGRWKKEPSVPLLSMYAAGFNVRDYEKSLEFYTKKVGLTCVLNVAPPGFTEKERYLEFTTDKNGTGTRFTVYCPGVSVEKFNEKYPIPDTSALSFNVADVKEAHDRLVQNGVEFCMPPSNFPWGSMAQFKDLDGNKIALTSNDPFEE